MALARHDLFVSLRHDDSRRDTGREHKVVAAVYLAAAFATTIDPNGTLLTVTSSANFIEGQRCRLNTNNAGASALYCVVGRVPDATHLFVIPLRTAINSGVVGSTTYTGTGAAGGAQVEETISETETAAALTVDLSDFAGGSATQLFVVLASADLRPLDAAHKVRAFVRGGMQRDEHYGGSNYGPTLTDTADTSDVVPFSLAALVGLTPGQRHDYRLDFGGESGRTGCSRAGLAALRVDPAVTPIYSQDFGAGTVTDTGAGTTVVQLTTLTPGQTYLVFWTCQQEHGTGGGGSRLTVEDGAGTTYARSDYESAVAASNVQAGGSFAVSAAHATLKIKLLRSTGAGTATARYWSLIAVPYTAGGSMPPAFDDLSEGLAVDSGSGTVAATWTPLADLTVAVTAGIGPQFEVISGRVHDATTGRVGWRPDWQSTPALVRPWDRVDAGFQAGRTLSAQGVCSMRFQTTERDASGTIAQSIQAIRAAGSGTVSYDYFSWWGGHVRHEVRSGPTDAVVVGVDLESGMVLRAWSTTGTSGLYKRDLADVVEVSRVLLNGTELTEATVQGSAPELLAASTWGWDATNRILYLYMPTTTRDPGSDSETVVAAVERWFSRGALTLTETDETTRRPYDLRLDRVPSVSRRVEYRSGRGEVQVTDGSVELVAVDGEFDDDIVQRVLEGMRATVRRAWPLQSLRVADTEQLSRAVTGEPKLGADALSLPLYDAQLSLRRPVSMGQLQVYRGTSTNEALTYDQPVPGYIAGKVYRQPAYRVSSEGGGATSCRFAVCLHGLTTLHAVYASASATDPIATGGATTAADLAAGQFVLKNAGTGGSASYNADQVWVDVTGRNVTTFQDIVEDLVVGWPFRVDETVGYGSSTVSTSTHTPAATGGVCKITSVTPFSVGAFVRVGTATTYYHAVVTAVNLAPTPDELTLVPLYLSGDAPISTTYAAGSTVMVFQSPTGLALTDVDRGSLRALDRFWRTSYSGGLSRRTSLTLSLLLSETETVFDGLSKLAGAVGAAWGLSPEGRVFVTIPDREPQNRIEFNPGFEFDLTTSPSSSRSAWPFRPSGSNDGQATYAMTTSNKFLGSQCLDLTKGRGATLGGLAIDVWLPRPGSYVLTCMVALRAGEDDWFRLSVVDPWDGLATFDSALVELSSTTWARVSLAFTTRGCGLTSARLYPGARPEREAATTTALAVWLDGSAPVAAGTWLADGEALGTWVDLSGAGHDATQGTSTKRPTYRAGQLAAASPELRGSLLFDGTDDGMSTGYSITAAPLTIVMAVRMTASATTRVLSGSNNWFFGPRSGVLRYFANAGALDISGGTITTGQWYVVSVVHDGASARIFVDGVQVASGSGATAGPGTLCVGPVSAVTSSTDVANAAVGELRVWTAALSDADHETAVREMRQRWSVGAAEVYVDNVELYQVAAILDATNFADPDVELDPETYFEVSAEYQRSQGDNSRPTKIVATDSTALGLSTAVSRARSSTPAARRLDLETEGLLGSSASAAGVATALAAYYGRPRAIVSGAAFGVLPLPRPGQLVYLEPGTLHTPTTEDRHPVLSVIEASSSPDSGHATELKLEMPFDFAADRTRLLPSDLPLGAIVVVTRSGGSPATACPTGYDEVLALRGYYVEGAAAPDLTTVRGSPTHTHDVAHTHALASHTHTFAIAATTSGAGEADPRTGYGTVAGGVAEIARPIISSTVPVAYVPAKVTAARGASTSGGHTHPVSESGAGTLTVAAATATSSAASASTTLRGTNDRTRAFVFWCKRSSGTPGAAFSTDIALGYVAGAAAPTGWALNTDVQGALLRGARQEIGSSTVSTTLGATFTPTEAGSTLTLTSGVGVNLYQRLTITSGGGTAHVVVTAVLTATTFTVLPLHEEGDVANGTAMTTGGSTVTANREQASYSETIPAHRHQASGSTGVGAIPGHTHTAAHVHTGLSGSRIAQVGVSATAGIADTVYRSGESPLPGEITFHAAVHLHRSPCDGDANSVDPIALATDSTASSSAGGDITGGTKAAEPPRYAMPFIQPTGSQTVVPVGAVIFWDGTSCPTGWERHVEAEGLLIAGAAAATAAGAAGAGGHSHGFDATAHTVTHAHGGTLTTYTSRSSAMEEQYPPGSIPHATDKVASGDARAGYYATRGHRHAIAVSSIQSVAASLAAASGTSSTVSGDSARPPSKRLVVCRKL